MTSPKIIKVLVVEDEESYREMHTRRLRKEGYEVFSAETHEQAIDLIDRHFFHAAILDISLDMTDNNNQEGMQILKRLHSKQHDTGVVMVTAYPKYGYIRDSFREYHVVDFLDKKNYLPSDFRKAVAEAAVKAQQFLENQRSEAKKSVVKYDHLFARLVDVLPHSSHMGIAKIDIAQIIQRIISPMTPIVENKQFAHIEETDESCTDQKKLPIFENKYWSYFLGDAVRIRVGERKQIADEMRQLDISNNNMTVSGGLAGYFQIVEDVSHDEFNQVNQETAQ